MFFCYVQQRQSQVLMTCLAQPGHIIRLRQKCCICTIRRRRGASGSLTTSQYAGPLSSLRSLSGLQALHRALDEAEVQKNALGTQLQAIRREDEQNRAALEVSADAHHAAWQGPRDFLAAGGLAAPRHAQDGQERPTHPQKFGQKGAHGESCSALEH